MVVVPLAAQGRSLLVRAAVRRPATISAHQVESLQILVGQASVGLQNHVLVAELRGIRDDLSHQAEHDALTGLANRKLFGQHLVDSISRGGPVALLLLDLDRFKEVNDTLGHRIGDELLVAVARRLRNCVRPADLVSRLGGDEFSVVLDGDSGEDAAAALAARICEALTTPFGIRGHEVRMSTSVGIALTEGGDGGADDEELIVEADLALYRAKTSGGATWHVFTADLKEEALERSRLASALSRAVEQDELTLAYQPIVSTVDGTITSLEALVRWNDPERGLVGPDEFIPLAEDIGFISTIGSWVIERACSDFRHRRTELIDDTVSLSINVSPRQLTHPEFVVELQDVLRRTGLRPEQLIMELTERVVARDEIRDQLGRIREMGIRLAIDDFGAGQAALSYVQRFRPDILKIDKSFVDGLAGGSENVPLVRAMTNLAHDLGIVIVAEGVETPEQLAELTRLGCDAVQGYLLQRPAPLEELIPFIVERRAAAMISTTAPRGSSG